MNYKVKKELQHRYGVAVLLLCLALLMGLSNWLLITPWASSMNTTQSEQTQLQAEVQATQAMAIMLTENVDSAEKSFPNLLMMQEIYITQLGNTAMEKGLAIDELTAGAIFAIPENTLTALPITVAVQGAFANITDFVNTITTDDYVVVVESISYRTEGDYPWMYRAIDTMQPLAWWDVSDYALPEETEEETPILTAQDLMDCEADPVCYLSLYLIGTGGG
ncbi:type 4a pilus biogenesis protein PilO [Bengtsoniella intestinalis]|uniref:type 4a pilus biogenesis protein PilO n=1 Tax=Bengtsoniella intestinalis TaxID=3073143 RepID=UPI00391EFFF5